MMARDSHTWFRSTRACRSLGLLLGIMAAAALGCSSKHEHHDGPKRSVGPATIVLQIGEPEALRRPAVEFDHDVHTKATADRGCGTCHRVDGSGKMHRELAGSEAAGDDPDALMDFYHDKCLSCHQESGPGQAPSGPVTCGECHAERPPAVAQRDAMRLDYALHYKHIQAEGDSCDGCHHVYDEATKKLTYQKGAEDPCSSCHGATKRDGVRSLHSASHQACVGCHQQRIAAGGEAGPIECAGCHDASMRPPPDAAETPRLMRGQPDMAWIDAPGAGTELVAFDHQLHEKQTRSCASCHHQTRPDWACETCHTVKGSDQGRHITLEDAFHDPRSRRSCVGCHQQTAQQKQCAGCHHTINAVPGSGACATCHSGPRPGATVPKPTLAHLGALTLPPTSADFPETVSIDRIPGEYGAAWLPHRKIVESLLKATRSSKLATRFHGPVETLCASCHHNAPVGMRPAPCSSCHTDRAEGIDDKPALQAAYHRQCLGCHQQMAIGKDSCTACHGGSDASKSKESGQ